MYLFIFLFFLLIISLSKFLFLVNPHILNQLDDIISEISQSASFTIFVKKTHVPVKVDFLKDEKPIKIDSIKYAYTMEEKDYSFTLTINDDQIVDAGSYTFVVSNTFGKSTASGRLLIKCNIYLFVLFISIQYF